MTEFLRIEMRISDRDELGQVSVALGLLGASLAGIANNPQNSDEAAMLLARERIKQASQQMRKGLNDVD